MSQPVYFVLRGQHIGDGDPCRTQDREFVCGDKRAADCHYCYWHYLKYQVEVQQRTDVTLCDACDGEGSLSHQWHKEAVVKRGGVLYFTESGRPYYKVDGKSLDHKTIGGNYHKCRGKGTL